MQGSAQAEQLAGPGLSLLIFTVHSAYRTNEKVDDCPKELIILFLRCLVGASCQHAQGHTDHQIWSWEGIFLQVRLAGTVGVFRLLCSMRHGSPAWLIWAYLT